MKVPKHIKETINCIEKTTKKLGNLEYKIYDWLESKEIDIDNLDMELEFLMHHGNGKYLIESLERKEIIL